MGPVCPKTKSDHLEESAREIDPGETGGIPAISGSRNDVSKRGKAYMYKRVANAYFPTGQSTDDTTGTNEEQKKKAYDHDTAITMRLTKDEDTIQRWIEDNEEKKKRTLDEQDVDDQQAAAERRVLQIRSRRTVEGGDTCKRERKGDQRRMQDDPNDGGGDQTEGEQEPQNGQESSGKAGNPRKHPTNEEVATVRHLL